MKQHDHPLHEVAVTASAHILDGWTIYQKFTCEKCGERQMIDEPNRFYTQGKCGDCGHVTDIVEHGCNYMATKGPQEK